nr:hypothetical protein Iba_chr03fCG5190 [Ipomoea batatas]
MRPRSLQLKHHRRSGSITFITPIIVCFVRTQNSAPAHLLHRMSAHSVHTPINGWIEERTPLAQSSHGGSHEFSHPISRAGVLGRRIILGVESHLSYLV